MLQSHPMSMLVLLQKSSSATGETQSVVSSDKMTSALSSPMIGNPHTVCMTCQFEGLDKPFTEKANTTEQSQTLNVLSKQWYKNGPCFNLFVGQVTFCVEFACFPCIYIGFI